MFLLLLQPMCSLLCLAGGQPQGLSAPYEQTPLTNHGSCPVTQPHDNKTHIACPCALPLPTAHPHASLWRRGGGVTLCFPDRPAALQGGLKGQTHSPRS